MGVLSVESLDPHAEPSISAEDLPCPPTVDLLLSPAIDKLVADDSFAHPVEDATRPVQAFAGYQDVSPVHKCSHEEDEEEPEEQHLE